MIQRSRFADYHRSIFSRHFDMSLNVDSNNCYVDFDNCYVAITTRDDFSVDKHSQTDN